MIVFQTPLPIRARWLFLAMVLFYLFMAAIPSFAEIRPAFIGTELQKNETIWQGQQQKLYVKLYTTTSFSGSTRFTLPKVSGMLIMESEDRPLLGTEKIDGVSYIFKQYEIVLFPQYAGSLTVPPFPVEFAFRDTGGKVVEQNFSTDELQFSVKSIPGIDPSKPVVTTKKFKVDDR